MEHRYGDRAALQGVDLTVQQGSIFALLGPNGSGKTTLFRLISTLMPLQKGQITVAGAEVRDVIEVRKRIGIVFQSPSLDKKLSVDENIACQAALYGLSGAAFRKRRDEVLQALGLTDRRKEICEKLSGGLKRRVELAKGMLHRPRVLLLDEPSTGLDPGARLDLWEALRSMAAEGMTILLTTHLLEEAEKADQLAILAEGKIIANGTPDQLQAEMGDGLVTIHSEDPEATEKLVQEKLGLKVQRVQQQIRIHSDRPADLVPKLAELLGESARSITVGRPGLEDVFIAKTGHRFWSTSEAQE
ncbi:Daunorubicin/doxorubicin resistance ATP-binding protein DrrA [Roseimaritima multifibrata]|uniref:Daunorubicin/doxorubicin resistance ATP-binding protein DrrA n=1 Tax=Roseimaritima multifibrata TaxID=1930274 RepID=A0A517MMZ5_9BACT|nr:Daunorubicin/doxorubicin resistance ATP-binding protein DrrA [Roseimaritima multifibrata]